MADERDALIAPMVPLGAIGARTAARLAAIGERFAERNGGEEPTYLCHVCRDTGYTSRQKPDKFGDLCWVASPCEGGERPCLGRPETPESGNEPSKPAIPGGIRIEAGYWARRLQPERGSKDKKAPPAAAAQFHRRERSHPHGADLRDAVQRILDAEGS